MQASEPAGRSLRIALISGSAHGIGLATAQAMARCGYAVVLADVDATGVQRAVAGLVAEGCEVRPAVADLTSTAGCLTAVKVAVDVYGGLDVLVHCVGGFRQAKTICEIEDGEWERGLLLNLTSAFRMARAAVPHLVQSNSGAIVLVSSEAGRMPVGVTTAYYAAAKAGVVGLARHLALELGPANVTVNVVAPGTTLTERVAAIWDAERQARIVDATPLGRLAALDDQVGPILFLVSDAARYLTGVTIDVNGGRLML